MQGGQTIINQEGLDCSRCDQWTPAPAAVAFERVKNVEIFQCEFSKIGASAVDFGNGASNNIIDSCYFHDLSASAVQVWFFFFLKK